MTYVYIAALIPLALSVTLFINGVSAIIALTSIVLDACGRNVDGGAA
jgi:hypothetical protein